MTSVFQWYFHSVYSVENREKKLAAVTFFPKQQENQLIASGYQIS